MRVCVETALSVLTQCAARNVAVVSVNVAPCICILCFFHYRQHIFIPIMPAQLVEYCW